MIELLITSDVARYLEFKTITQILTPKEDNSLQVVPCSRSDIFSTKSISMIEKRILMKLLTFCMDYKSHQEQYQGLRFQIIVFIFLFGYGYSK